MSGAQPKLDAVLSRISFTSAAVPVISNVTAQPHCSAADIRRRLVEQVVAPVRWEDSIRTLLGRGFTRFVELGPGATLSGFMKRIDKSAAVLNVADVASLEATVVALME